MKRPKPHRAFSLVILSLFILINVNIASAESSCHACKCTRKMRGTIGVHLLPLYVKLRTSSQYQDYFSTRCSSINYSESKQGFLKSLISMAENFTGIEPHVPDIANLVIKTSAREQYQCRADYEVPLEYCSGELLPKPIGQKGEDTKACLCKYKVNGEWAEEFPGAITHVPNDVSCTSFNQSFYSLVEYKFELFTPAERTRIETKILCRDATEGEEKYFYDDFLTLANKFNIDIWQSGADRTIDDIFAYTVEE